ncbi:type ISP restriction/modification enzyme [Agriterribacter sp.]|uniref:type ISP restriction/modification enzyme n=1 Tax=Agriterribacter sp. TaxID=2821509 RepID=UPI002B5B6820|nr:type ISP restriction/modification enzyme [Agriterribacter sp.]HRO46809.1 hypothetical protein [Agriterribacter sp.]HRQ15582.1 hypothetical protein [Agriterribacter sp.]
MEAQYQQDFPVPQLFLNIPADAMRNAGRYIDFAAKAVSAIDPTVIQRIATDLGLSFVPEKEKESEVCYINSEEVRPEFKLSFAPVDVADYIFGALHSPAYRIQWEGLPETVLPQIPYPKDAIVFWELVKSGEQLRQIT